MPMLQLTLRRAHVRPSARWTSGKLYCSDVFVCDTLEPMNRGLSSAMPLAQLKKLKIKGQTAIPTGTYRLSLDYSPKFSGKAFYKSLGGLLPHVIAVPCFSGVLIHCGNTIADTAGCVLVGTSVGQGVIADSRKAFKRLMQDFLQPAAREGECIFFSVL